MPSEIICCEELFGRLDKIPKLLLMDVRLLGDFEASRLPGALSNCVFEVAFDSRLAELAPDRNVPVCVYGAGKDSLESSMATEKLCRAGYAKVWHLQDGLEGWQRAGYPIEGTEDAFPSSPHPNCTGWKSVNLSESRLEWTGRNLLNKHYGTLAIKSGRLLFDNNALAGGEFVFDMSGIGCADLKGDPLFDVLIAHLRSHDFFDVKVYPEARFVITSAAPILGAAPGAPNLALTGDLTLKDVTRSLAFNAATGFTPQGAPAAQAFLSFDRTLWNVIYGSGRFFRNLGGHLVNDLVEIELRIVADA